MFTNTSTIYDFSKENSLENWYVVDDVVMGGKSNSELFINEEGHGVFRGNVSLENNGGFSSIQYRLDGVGVEDAKKISIRLKGDGKRYQFRIKDNRRKYYSYIAYFQTNGDWQTIEIPLKDFYASFRGRTLDLPNFHHSKIEEVAFLIANKKAENFQLVIDKMELR